MLWLYADAQPRLQQPPVIWTFEDWLVQIPASWAKIVFKSPTQVPDLIVRFFFSVKSISVTFYLLTKLWNLDLVELTLVFPPQPGHLRVKYLWVDLEVGWS